MNANLNPEIRKSLEEALKLQAELIRLSVDHVNSETFGNHVAAARELFYLIAAIDQGVVLVTTADPAAAPT